jgi:hypothetical protein
MAVISAARLHSSRRYLQVEAKARDALRERALIGLVERLVGGEPGVPLRPVHRQRAEFRLELSG